MIRTLRLAALFSALTFYAAMPAAAQDVVYRADNPSSPTKIELGRRLFYEADLSINGTMACATCHEQHRGFADGNRTHPGALDHPGKRNVPGLQNVALQSHFTWASRTPDLEHQALTPLTGESPIEMGMKGQEAELQRRLSANACYVKLFSAAFPEKKGEISLVTVTQALATFERTLVSFGSPYDIAVKNGQPLRADAEAGRALFKGKGGCETCHSGPNFTDDAFHALEPATPTDRGLADESDRAEDAGLFRTPGLRNVMLTGPYFHDGKARTLPAAIRRHSLPAALSDADLADIEAFLAMLTDGSFLSDKRLSLPDVACPL
jgi:cytochrome c peroxidase